MALSTPLQTAFVALGVVIALACAIGIAIKVAGAEVSQPIGRRSRILGVVLGLLLAAVALWNPFQESFEVSRVRVDVAPTRYEGRCPMVVSLVGIVRANSGSGHVTADLYLSHKGRGSAGISPGGHEVVKATMENGDSLKRSIAIRRSGRDIAHFIVLAPEEKSASYPVSITCRGAATS